MKKLICLFFSIIISINLLGGSIPKKENDLELITLNYEEIEDKLIRFHVIANSDSEEDQAVKLLVRDKVLDYISTKLKDVNSLNKARVILNDNIDEVNEIAKQVLEDNNFDYDVNTMISRENFPDKVYGNYLFPQGNYEAFRIIIGNGEGHNWWCVMFPPLCFVDETKSDVDSKSLEENISNIQEEKDKNKKIKFKFKAVEVIKDILE